MPDLVFNLTPPKFPDHTVPHGRLSSDPRSQACWYFYLLAQKQKEVVGETLEDQSFRLLEDDLWMDKHYVQTARSVALLYGLESPDEFAKAWREVWEEARDCGLPEPAAEYVRLTPRVIVQ